MQRSDALKGIFWIVMFSLASVTADGVVRYVTLDGFPSSEILFWRCFLGIFLLLPFVLKGRVWCVTPAIFRLYLLRGMCAFCAIASWFYFLKFVDFTAIIAIGFTAPLITTILAVLFLKERCQAITIGALLLGFCGVLVVNPPWDAEFNIYLVLAMGSNLMWGISNILTKKLSASQTPMNVAFFFALVMTPLSLLVALPNWQWPDTGEWFYVLLFTLLATLGQVSLAKAFRHANLSVLMPFEYSQLLFAAVFSALVFGESITLRTLTGGLLILGGGYAVVRAEKQFKKGTLEIAP